MIPGEHEEEEELSKQTFALYISHQINCSIRFEFFQENVGVGSALRGSVKRGGRGGGDEPGVWEHVRDGRRLVHRSRGTWLDAGREWNGSGGKGR